MCIKEFYFCYGGYFGSYKSIIKKRKDLIYYSGPFPLEFRSEYIPEEVIRIRPNESEWKSFLESIKPFSDSWNDEYWLQMCDGTQWEVRIATDEFSFRCFGSNDYPDDFDEFMKAVRDFTGIRDFADWLNDE